MWVALVVAAMHSLVALIWLERIFSLRDGTERWAGGMMLAWTIDIWMIPLYAALGFEWELHSFSMLSLFGGAAVYAFLGYSVAFLWLRRTRSSGTTP